jgi:UDP-2,3-diacylglucosamine hydrolase
VIDFISDLHLQAAEPLNFAAWRSYLRQTRADAVFILGDLFEVWVGDDAAANSTSGALSFEAQCAEVLRETTARKPVYFMHGNRDFLLGPHFCNASGVKLLQDPCVLAFGGERWVLSHGDALCLDDLDYQRFRETVRTPQWQASFLAKPLEERRLIARGLREQSQARKLAASTYADADFAAAGALMTASMANHLIHGHTHRPADHLHGGALHRHVLSDWDMDAQPPRAQVLRLESHAQGPFSLSRILPTLS